MAPPDGLGRRSERCTSRHELSDSKRSWCPHGRGSCSTPDGASDNLVIYTMPGYDHMDEQLAELGKHRLGKSCLYINKLADVDLAVLEQIVADGVSTVRANHETLDD